MSGTPIAAQMAPEAAISFLVPLNSSLAAAIFGTAWYGVFAIVGCSYLAGEPGYAPLWPTCCGEGSELTLWPLPHTVVCC